MNESVTELLDVLHADYPALHQLIGDDYFDVMGCRYLKKYPPTEDSLADFGEFLSDFLRTENPYTNVPSLAELVDFESALRQAVEAVDTNTVAGDYHLHPSLTIMKLDWNAPQIWNALKTAQTVPEPEYKPGFYLVYRKADQTSAWRSATPLEVAALESVFHGLNFAELCEELCNLVDDVDTIPKIAETFINAWAKEGLLSVHTKEKKHGDTKT